MRTEELLDGFGRGNIGATGQSGAQKFEELRSIAGRETVCRVADDVGVHMFSKIESDGETARIGVGRVVGDRRQSGRVREADGDRR